MCMGRGTGCAAEARRNRERWNEKLRRSVEQGASAVEDRGSWIGGGVGDTIFKV